MILFRFYKTRSGRTVFGAGGVTHSVIVKSDTITKLDVDIRSKRLFFEYSENYLSKHVEFKSEIRK